MAASSHSSSPVISEIDASLRLVLIVGHAFFEQGHFLAEPGPLEVCIGCDLRHYFFGSLGVLILGNLPLQPVLPAGLGVFRVLQLQEQRLISEFRSPCVHLLQPLGFNSSRSLRLLVLLYHFQLLEPILLVIELHHVTYIVRPDRGHSVGEGRIPLAR